jgi:hypothetical protein
VPSTYEYLQIFGYVNAIKMFCIRCYFRTGHRLNLKLSETWVYTSIDTICIIEHLLALACNVWLAICRITPLFHCYRWVFIEPLPGNTLTSDNILWPSSYACWTNFHFSSRRWISLYLCFLMHTSKSLHTRLFNICHSHMEYHIHGASSAGHLQLVQFLSISQGVYVQLWK